MKYLLLGAVLSFGCLHGMEGPSQQLETLSRNDVFRAAEMGDLELVNCGLSSQLVGLNEQDNCGNTLLHYAASNGRFSLVETLLFIQADPNIQNAMGYKPIDRALAIKSRIYNTFQNKIERARFFQAANQDGRFLDETIGLLRHVSQPSINPAQLMYQTAQFKK